MYERSAIVIERYMEKVLGINKEYNLKKNQENFQELIHEIEEYQVMTEKETKIIQEFDEVAKKIQYLQKEQEKLYKINRKVEDDREQLFMDLSEDAQTLESKFKKIENVLEKNNQQLKEIREEYIQYLSEFLEKQKDRNKCEKARRIGEGKYIEYIRKVTEEFNGIDLKDIIGLKDFINAEKEKMKKDVLEVMIKNGKNERVPFNQEVLQKAIDARIKIAEKEAECYIITYDRMKKLLAETDNENIKLDKYNKAFRDVSVKLAFLREEKEYIIGFLDYERMAAFSSTNVHKKVMQDACDNFEKDLIQIRNLYELILKEITNKATKKAYKELYNKTYLRDIEAKEKNFEQEVNNVNIKMATVINSNYWRIEGIKNIYNVFQNEVSEKFEKDLSEYKLEELEEVEEVEEKKEKEIETIELGDDFFKEYEDDYEDDDEAEDYDDEDDDEDYDDDDYDDEDYDDEDDDEDYDDEDDDEDYDDEDYDDEDYDDEDYDDEDYDDEDYDDEDYDDEDYDDEDYDDEDYDDEDDDEDYDDEDDDDEYSIDKIIEKSRKKSAQKESAKKESSKKANSGKENKNREDNKGLFNKLFKK